MFYYLDQAIYATHKTHQHVVIWSSIDDQELDILVEVWLQSAKVNVSTADKIDMLLDNHMKLKVGIILLPRFLQSIEVYTTYGIGIK